MCQPQESHPFPVGSHVPLRLKDGTSLSLQVSKPFLPVTKSLVYLVRPEPPDPNSNLNDLPPEIILKIFDPRYIDERTPYASYHRPWSLEAETEAVRYRQEIAEGKRPDDLTLEVVYRDGKDKPYLWEAKYYRYLKDSSDNEVDALNCLQSMQGTFIPKLYGLGNVIYPESTRSIEPPAVLLEYIPSVTLAEYSAAKRPNIPFSVFRPLVDAVRKFKGIGVYHGDINGSNILVSPSEAPTKAVLIDFGCAGVRENAEPDQDWMADANFYNDVNGVRVALKMNGVSWEDSES